MRGEESRFLERVTKLWEDTLREDEITTQIYSVSSQMYLFTYYSMEHSLRS